MLTRARRLLLVILPCCLGLALLPVARLYQQRARVRDAQVATRELRVAVSRGMGGHIRLTAVKSLLARGCDINVRGMANMTLLHCVASGIPVEDGAGDDAPPDSPDLRVALIKFLLSQGAEINAQNATGRTPLMQASQRLEPEVVRALLEHGAEVNCKERFTGNTALSIAVYALGVCKVYTPSNSRTRIHERNGRYIVALLKAAGAHQ